MAYKKLVPKQLGETFYLDIDLKEIVPFIDWNFFFLAWRITGKFPGIEKVCECASCKTQWLQEFPSDKREKAKEALKLFRDAQEMLRRFEDEKSIRLNAKVVLLPAHSEDDAIVVLHNDVKQIIPLLRQQKPSSDGFCYCLSDFLASSGDYVGVFATTVLGVEKLAKDFESADDVYHSILVKTLSDRLAEASAEWLHYIVRKEVWGYSPNETLDVEAMLKAKYQGIRPAVGYPSLPDQSIIFELDKLIRFGDIGIRLTENGAMYPNASVSGMYFSHPKSKYFAVGKIDENQLKDYAQRKGKNPDETRKWLASNLQ